MRPLWPLLACLLPAPSMATRYPFDVYVDVLPGPEIEHLYQAPDGALWVSVGGGVVRFDGSAFEQWTVDEGVPAAYTHGVTVGGDGTVWVATAGQQPLYSPYRRRGAERALRYGFFVQVEVPVRLRELHSVPLWNYAVGRVQRRLLTHGML